MVPKPFESSSRSHCDLVETGLVPRKEDTSFFQDSISHRERNLLEDDEVEIDRGKVVEAGSARLTGEVVGVQDDADVDVGLWSRLVAGATPEEDQRQDSGVVLRLSDETSDVRPFRDRHVPIIPLRSPTTGT